MGFTDINHFSVSGRLTRDAEKMITQSGLCIVKFSIAVNHSRKVDDQWEDKAEFFEVKWFGNLAKAVSDSLAKGARVMVAGRLVNEEWENSDGKHKATIVYADTVIPSDTPQTSQEKRMQAQTAPISKQLPPQSAIEKGVSSYKDDDYVDDIPF